MNRWIATTILTFACCGVARAQSTQPATQMAAPADVPVTSVVLFSSGVGYFEHVTDVHGDATAQLPFKANQINDVLKSLIFSDSGGGTVGSVTYASQDPLAKTLKSFQVDITANPTMADLLNQLRGAHVTLTAGPDTVKGIVLGVETRDQPAGEKGPVTHVSVLNLLIDGTTLRAFELDQLRDLRLDDPNLQQGLIRALTALSQSRDQDKKPISIAFHGQGDRKVSVGYVVETPIWKTSYRLVLGEKPTLQGWAIVENQTDNDWNNVQLSLVSGRPISFVEDLYMPLYVPRPVVEPELYASLRPQMYAGGETAQPAVTDMPAANAMASAELGHQLAFNAARLQNMQQAVEGKSAALRDFSGAVRSIGSATELGELFQYNVGSVSLPRQQSAMLPIVNDPIDVQRVAIYNQSVLPRNPLNGVRLKNTTGKHLLQGPITVLDGGGYAGDAQIEDLPPGQDRLISYGIDLQTFVDASSGETSGWLVSGHIDKGVLVLDRREISEMDYAAQNKGAKDESLIVESPRTGGWNLASDSRPIETTDVLYRFEMQLPAGGSKKLAVKQTHTFSETVKLLDADPGQLLEYTSWGEIPKATHDALAKAAELKRAAVETQQAIESTTAQLKSISEEQKRLRENLQSIDHKSDYADRIMKKLDTQESSIETLQKTHAELQAKQDMQQKALDDYLANLSVQ